MVSEEYLGQHTLYVIDAQSISTAKFRGQRYDGCSTVAGAKAGVAQKIEEIEPRAVFTIVLAMHSILVSAIPLSSHCLCRTAWILAEKW